MVLLNQRFKNACKKKYEVIARRRKRFWYFPNERVNEQNFNLILILIYNWLQLYKLKTLHKVTQVST